MLDDLRELDRLEEVTNDRKIRKVLWTTHKSLDYKIKYRPSAVFEAGQKMILEASSIIDGGQDLSSGIY